MSFKKIVTDAGFESVNELSRITGVETFTLRNRWKSSRKEFDCLLEGARTIKASGELVCVNVSRMELKRALDD